MTGRREVYGAERGGDDRLSEQVRIRPSSGARRPPPPLRSAQPIGKIVEQVVLDIAQRLPRESAEGDVRCRLLREWPQLVGSRLAGLLRPGPSSAATPATLVVWARNPVAMSEAARQLRDLAERIRSRLPDAPWRRVQFRLEPTDLTEPEEGQ
ncbi:MAG: DUF721 domain-containing protein [Kiritimatiellae bacterium]|nr:DUF721 domain-containing protein [Kiritimatiellia bacterium]